MRARTTLLCAPAHEQVLLAVLVVGLLIRFCLAALGVTPLDLDALSLVMLLLFWHFILLL